MSTSRFERMVALPEEEYHNLKSLHQSNNPLQNKFQSLSSEYQKQGFIDDPYTRVQRQGETLHEMKRVKDDLSKRLLALTPKPYQSRAQNLFHFIENKMSINDKGEILKNDGTTIDGSNIADLIQHAVRDRRRNIIPPGWSHFLNILRDNNTPRMIMNYETLEELVTPKVKTETSPLAFTFSSPKARLSSPPKSALNRLIKAALKKHPSTLTKKNKAKLTTLTNKSKAKLTRGKREPDYFKDYVVRDTKRAKYI